MLLLRRIWTSESVYFNLNLFDLIFERNDAIILALLCLIDNDFTGELRCLQIKTGLLLDLKTQTLFRLLRNKRSQLLQAFLNS